MIFELTQNSSPKPSGIAQTPQPDIVSSRNSIAQNLPLIFIGGRRNMSPVILIVFFIDPIQALRSSTAVGGTTSATGLPKRVMRMVFWVERTRSITARHLALNSEYGYFLHGVFSDGHSNILWSIY